MVLKNALRGVCLLIAIFSCQLFCIAADEGESPSQKKLGSPSARKSTSPSSIGGSLPKKRLSGFSLSGSGSPFSSCFPRSHSASPKGAAVSSPKTSQLYSEEEASNEPLTLVFSLDSLVVILDVKDLRAEHEGKKGVFVKQGWIDQASVSAETAAFQYGRNTYINVSSAPRIADGEKIVLKVPGLDAFMRSLKALKDKSEAKIRLILFSHLSKEETDAVLDLIDQDREVLSEAFSAEKAYDYDEDNERYRMNLTGKDIKNARTLILAPVNTVTIAYRDNCIEFLPTYPWQAANYKEGESGNVNFPYALRLLDGLKDVPDVRRMGGYRASKAVFNTNAAAAATSAFALDLT